MKTSEVLYKAADVMARDGFSPYLADGGGCGCFIRAVSRVDPARSWSVSEILLPIIGAHCSNADLLIAAGWKDATATNDAVAALLIAADIAAAEGK